jgi:mRNA-capping enzyme
MLGDAEYRVTWKADGTRFMLLLMLDGTYLIDRRFQFRRVQMRFPSHAQRHNVTLLDGEMVVDVDIATGTATRRYLAYDIMCINQQSVVQLPFTKRFELIESEVVNPKRQLEVRSASHASLSCVLRLPAAPVPVLLFREG